MIPLPTLPGLQAIPPSRPGALLRELAPRQDRLPVDERVDLPEIQESFRVSFSDEARAAGMSGAGNERPAGNSVSDRRLDAYRAIAGL